jgi:hypothetical protein
MGTCEFIADELAMETNVPALEIQFQSYFNLVRYQ